VIPVLSGSANVGDTNADGKLDPGETWQATCDRDAIAAQSPVGGINVVNTANVLGIDPVGTIVNATASDDADVFVEEFIRLMSLLPQEGLIIDIRNCPGGDDSTAVAILDRFCDRKRIAFHRRTKIGPGDGDLSPLRTWHIEPRGPAQFIGPIVLLTCDSVFSGGEVFALAVKQLPYVTIIGDHTNGTFSYELEKRLPNGWRYSLSYQIYSSADDVCYESKGVPVDIELFNTVADIDAGVDPLITRALEVLGSD